MSKNCLHGPDDNRVVCFTALTERPSDGFGIEGGVPSWCAGHVSFNVTGVCEIKACRIVVFLNQLDLGVCRRRGNRGGLSVLIEPGIPDDCVDSVANLDCSVERLEDECCDAFATAVALGTLV